MSFIYIKGTPGSGKTTICRELAARGYEAHDADDEDMGGPYNNATNKRVAYPNDLTPEWFAAHSFKLIPEAIEVLRKKAKNKNIFLCGTASNEDDLWHLFDQILFLDIDEQTLKHRIAKRTDNDYGQSPHQLELIIEKYHADKAKRDRPNVIEINANKSLEEVIAAIIKQLPKD